MNNQDRFAKALENDNYIAAALIALEFANGCNSKTACWHWADKAVELVPSLAAYTGKLTWPNTADMREHLETLTSAQALADDASNVKTALTPPASPPLLDQAKLLAARATASIDSGSFDRAVACATLAQALAAIHQAETATLSFLSQFHSADTLAAISAAKFPSAFPADSIAPPF